MTTELSSVPPTVTQQELATQTRLLKEKDEKGVQRALSKLIEYGDPGMEALLNTLSTMEKQRKKNPSNIAICFAFLFAIILIVSVLTHFRDFGGFFSSFTAVLAGTSVIGTSQKQGAKLLAQLDDVRAVGVLTDALVWKDASLASDARNALTRLLPKIKESDAALLPPERRKILLKQFDDRNASSTFLSAILKALEQVGEADDLPTVKRIASSEKGSRFLSLTKAAQECLPYLQARIERKEQSTTLLRPSNAFDPQPQTLLRPASPAPDEAASELIRPMN